LNAPGLINAAWTWSTYSNIRVSLPYKTKNLKA